jgi:hypothetical protein
MIFCSLTYLFAIAYVIIIFYKKRNIIFLFLLTLIVFPVGKDLFIALYIPVVRKIVTIDIYSAEQQYYLLSIRSILISVIDIVPILCAIFVAYSICKIQNNKDRQRMQSNADSNN